jgi:hypothetical protein
MRGCRVAFQASIGALTTSGRFDHFVRRHALFSLATAALEGWPLRILSRGSVMDRKWMVFVGTWLASISCCGVATRSALAIELLGDPSFEDPVEIDGEGGWWSDVYGFFPTPTANATASPRTGVQHAELILDPSQIVGVFGPTMRSSAFVGEGGAESISDFTGQTLTLTNHYKVTSLNMTSPDPELNPSVLVRTYLAFFSDQFGFIGYGGIDAPDYPGDNYPEAVSEEYLEWTYSIVVPNFGTPITSVDYTIGLIVPTTDNGAMTGTATVVFDDVSLDMALPVTSDFNGNLVVDAADYTIWRDGLGQTGLAPFAPGDANGDGSVTTEDYAIWKSQFGQTLPMEMSMNSVIVPEPCSAIFSLVAAAIGMAIARPRMHSAIEERSSTAEHC